MKGAQAESTGRIRFPIPRVRCVRSALTRAVAFVQGQAWERTYNNHVLTYSGSENRRSDGSQIRPSAASSLHPASS